ncbi:MAG: hypothetical protein L6R28_19685 [Planctomycetes bacterium]|nr:hypothetical protein [Planctomycetota bacterium]
MPARIACLAFALVLCARACAGDAAEPKEVTVKSTINCIGINWTLGGDDNRNATCTVRFRRKGAAEWREALDLFRIKHRWRDAGMNESGRDVNAICGSIFRLAPGTAYEIKLDLKDPDGGAAEEVLESTTLCPAFPAGGNVVAVGVGELEGKLAAAKPGNILVLAKGDHGKGFSVKKGGEPGKPLVITGAGTQEAKVGGQIDLQASHVWIDNLLLEHPAVTFPERGKTGVKVYHKTTGAVVSRCCILNTYNGVHVYGANTVACDNYIKGDKPKWEPHDQVYRHPIEARRQGQLGGEGVDFNHDKEGRFVAAFNEITHVADGVSYGDNNTDIYHNLIYEICDDNIEPDYAYDNYRVWGNNGRTGLVGFSFQPLNGGPWYFFENQMTGNGSYIFKIKDDDGRGPCVWVNNTFVQTKNYSRYQVALQSGGIWTNNVWAHLPKGHLGASYEDYTKECSRLYDYNAYATGDPEIPLIRAKQKWTLKAMQAAGLDTHSHFIDAVKDLTNIPENAEERHPGTSEPIQPRDGTPLIDGGHALPNISGPFAGKAPDIGAYEKGLGVQWHGPRHYTKNGFACGLPKGWKDAGAGGAELKLIKEALKAEIAVTFEKLEGEARWQRFEAVLNEGTGTGSTKVYAFLDGLAGRVLTAEGTAQLVAAQVDPRGLWIVKGSCAAADLPAVREDFFTLVNSMQQTIAVAAPAP